uniref:Uncharacterized protein n=1 Tax=Panagrolaimus superbus TaxID=310955 RepID=A0A914XXW3_9BILA
MYYILSHASLPTQIKLSQSCKDILEKLYKRHDYQVDKLWMNGSNKSYYQIYNGKIYIYPTTQFLLQLKHQFIVNKSLFLYNVKEQMVEQVLAKLDYTKVEEVILSCCIVDFAILKKILKIPSLKLISFWSSNVINTGKILITFDIEEYITDNFPNVYIHHPD